MTDLAPRSDWKESVATLVVWSAACLIVGALSWILLDVLVNGASQFSASFLTAEPDDAGRAGGISSIIVSTMLLLLVTLTSAVPLALATAIALTEHVETASAFGRLIRRSLDVLAAVPSIVFGLFGNAFFCVKLGMGYSIWSGGLTLACMALPILIRTTEQAIRDVPKDYSLAAAALGLSRVTTLRRIVLPCAMPGIASGLVLGIGRALAETAALIFTAGYVTRMPESLEDSGRALSVHIYDMAMNVPGGNSRAYATAAVLVTLLLLINTFVVMLSSYAGRNTPAHSSRRVSP